MVYRGKVQGGIVIPEAGAGLPDGAEVRIELIPSLHEAQERDPLLRMTDLSVETGIPDLASNIDHYLYGHPKATDAG